jgi:hypothetical protein
VRPSPSRRPTSRPAGSTTSTSGTPAGPRATRRSPSRAPTVPRPCPCLRRAAGTPGRPPVRRCHSPVARATSRS